MVGTLSAYIGGVTDGVLMRFVDSMYAFPDTLFAILMAALIKGQLGSHISGFLAPLAEIYKLSGGLLGVLLTLGLTGWLTTSRLVRSQVLSLKNTEYVLACRLAGASDWFIIRTHLLPNVAPVILLSVTFIVPNAILLEAGLSFMGIGVDPPTPSWGTMIASGTQSIQSYPHLLIVPALAIGSTLLALNVIGDALRDLLDPALSGDPEGLEHDAEADRCNARRSGDPGDDREAASGGARPAGLVSPQPGLPARTGLDSRRRRHQPRRRRRRDPGGRGRKRLWQDHAGPRPCPCCSARPAAASSSPMPI